MILFLYLYLVVTIGSIACSLEIPPEQLLRDKLVSQSNPLVRPVLNSTDRLTVYYRFKLLKIVDMDIKNQVFSLNVKIQHKWQDCKLYWDPDDYQGISSTSLKSDEIWLPDTSLTSADNPVLELPPGLVVVKYDGTIEWTTVTTLNSYCPVDVLFYPFDIQKCFLKFIAWTYNGDEIYLKLMDFPDDNSTEIKRELFQGEDSQFSNSSYTYIISNLTIGMDLSEFYPSAEFDIIEISGFLFEKYYSCCTEPYPDIQFNITLRRHSNFYLTNIVLPLLGISYLSTLVFYLPVDSFEKITLCVSVFTAQIMFLLLMIDNIPVTSLSIPLLGKLIIFNMVVVVLSVLCTVIVLNIHCRQPNTHRMSKLVEKLISPDALLLKMLLVAPPTQKSNSLGKTNPPNSNDIATEKEQSVSISRYLESTPFKKALQNISAVRNYFQKTEEHTSVCENWKSQAAALDRIFLITFNVAFFVGNWLILMNAPSLTDKREALGWKSL